MLSEESVSNEIAWSEVQPASTDIELPEASRPEGRAVTGDRPSLISRLEALAIAVAPDVAALIESGLIEAGQMLPVIGRGDPVTLPAALLEAWESTLLEACDAGDEEAGWLLTQVLAWRLAHVGVRDVHAMHRAACAHARRGEQQADEAAKATWRARSIELDLALAMRLDGASRLFALRDMAVRHADAVEVGAAAVLKVWVDVLLYTARQQLGDSAAARLAEAKAIAERLCDLPEMADEGRYLLALVLLRHASTERGDARTSRLIEAQALLDTLFSRTPSARIAMAVAEVALERGRDGLIDTAKTCLAHALAHAFIAGCDPRWQAAALQCRLAIQLAYESLPDMSPQGQVALDLARKLERQPLPPGATIESMARTFIRHGDYARACRLCARAWLAGTRFRTLSAAWRQAGAGWQDQLTTARDHADWQENERQRRIAAQWQ